MPKSILDHENDVDDLLSEGENLLMDCDGEYDVELDMRMKQLVEEMQFARANHEDPSCRVRYTSLIEEVVEINATVRSLAT